MRQLKAKLVEVLSRLLHLVVHDWTNWSDPTPNDTWARQARTCRKCNYKQTRLVNY